MALRPLPSSARQMRGPLAGVQGARSCVKTAANAHGLMRPFDAGTQVPVRGTIDGAAVKISKKSASIMLSDDEMSLFFAPKLGSSEHVRTTRDFHRTVFDAAEALLREVEGAKLVSIVARPHGGERGAVSHIAIIERRGRMGRARRPLKHDDRR